MTKDTPFLESQSFSTCQCDICVVKCEWQVNGENVYVVISQRRKDNRIITRFANKQQLENILRSYTNLKVGSKNTANFVKSSEMN